MMKNWIKKHSNIFVFICYVFLTLILTIPVIFEINKNIPGKHDAFETFSYPFYYKSVSLIDYFKSSPQLIFDFKSYLLILDKLIGEPLAYNIIWFLSFSLSAIGAYLLCNYFVKNKIASFIGGFIFAFSPLHSGYSMAFGGGTHIEFIPFFIFFLIKYLNSLKVRYIAPSFVFFIFIMKNEPHFAAYTILFIIIAGLYYLFKNKLYKNKRFISHSLIVILIGAGFFVSFYKPLIKISISEQNFLDPGIQAAVYFSNDLATFFTPAYLHPLWGKFFLENIADKFSGNMIEWAAYIGFTPLFFLLFAILNRKRDKYIFFWVFIFFFFLIMSLGPYLRFFGLVEPKIPLPYLLFYKYIPFFENIRAVGRAFIYSSLSLAVLVSFGFKFFIEKYTTKLRGVKVISVIILFFMIFEYWSVPDTSGIEMPKIYQILSQDKENYAILQPGITSSHGLASMFAYYNSFHNKKIIGGFSFAREDPNSFQFEKNTPVINTILYNLSFGYPTNDSKSFISYDPMTVSNLIFNKNNIRYIVLHKKLAQWDIGNKNFVNLNNFIEKSIKVKKILDDSETIVYRIKTLPHHNQSVIVQNGINWGKTNQLLTGEFATSFKEPEATLTVKNFSNKNKNIEFKFSTRNNNKVSKKIELYLNEQFKSHFFVNTILPDKQENIIKIDNIKPGDNVIKLKISSLNTQTLNSENNVIMSLYYKEY